MVVSARAGLSFSLGFFFCEARGSTDEPSLLPSSFEINTFFSSAKQHHPGKQAGRQSAGRHADREGGREGGWEAGGHGASEAGC